MNTAKKITLYSFIALLTLPSIIWTVVFPGLEQENLDNRALRKMPVLNVITMKEFPKEYEGYYADNLPFRNALISFYAELQYALLKNAESSKVLYAGNGWLFYKNRTDGDTIGDYKRITLFTDEELAKIAKNMSDLQAYLKKRGSDFILFIGPNKENVYSNYMPKWVLRNNQISRTEQLIKYLREHTDVKVVFPYEEILAEKDDCFLYYATDTHWNAAGGYIGTRKLMDLIGDKLPPLKEMTVKPSKREGAAAKAGYDLANLTGARRLITEPYELSVTGYGGADTVETSNTEGIIRYHSPSAKRGRLMMVRDSFAWMMIPIISRYYTDSEFIIYHNFKKEMIDLEKPDMLIYETVERYLPMLIKYDFSELPQ